MTIRKGKLALEDKVRVMTFLESADAMMEISAEILESEGHPKFAADVEEIRGALEELFERMEKEIQT